VRSPGPKRGTDSSSEESEESSSLYPSRSASVPEDEGATVFSRKDGISPLRTFPINSNEVGKGDLKGLDQSLRGRPEPSSGALGTSREMGQPSLSYGAKGAMGGPATHNLPRRSLAVHNLHFHIFFADRPETTLIEMTTGQFRHKEFTRAISARRTSTRGSDSFPEYLSIDEVISSGGEFAAVPPSIAG